MRKLVSTLLCAALFLTLTCPAYAAKPPLVTPGEAGAYLQERGIYQGDGSGSLKLDKGLTRAEMAALLTRLHGEGEVNPEHYAWACYFTDVPDWAKPYVGYCVASLLVAGYDESHYGPMIWLPRPWPVLWCFDAAAMDTVRTRIGRMAPPATMLSGLA